MYVCKGSHRYVLYSEGAKRKLADVVKFDAMFYPGTRCSSKPDMY